MSDLYRELMLDHARHPRHFGEIVGATFRRAETNASCGDSLDVAVRLSEDGRVADVGFTGAGCVISFAAASMLAEALPGRHAEDLAKLGLADIEQLFGATVTPTRTRCALLALRAVQKGQELWKQDSS